MITSKEISDDNVEYLTVENPSEGRFYLLPKIYKPSNPGLPIVSANGHPNRSQSLLTYTICLYITTVCPRYHISYQATPSDISKETLLISLDVVSLYTSIPNEDGIEACREARNTRETMDQLISGPCNRCVEMQHL